VGNSALAFSVRRASIFLPGLALFLAAGSPLRAQGLTDGWSQYQDTYEVQKPYNLPVSDRFSDSGGIYSCWILPNDKPFKTGTPTGPRTEMRWTTWKDQKIEHMFEADVMYDPGTNHTCIFQVKSNSSGEAVYLQVATNGDLRQSTGTPFLKDYAGKWFNLKATYNPATGGGKVWIDDVQKWSGSHSNSSDWYFKNGTYNNGMTSGTVSKSHYKNVKFWIHVPSATLAPPRREARMTRGLRGDNGGAFILTVSPSGAGIDPFLFDMSGRRIRAHTLRAKE
jgi:hypothetical protein